MTFILFCLFSSQEGNISSLYPPASTPLICDISFFQTSKAYLHIHIAISASIRDVSLGFFSLRLIMRCTRTGSRSVEMIELLLLVAFARGGQ